MERHLACLKTINILKKKLRRLHTQCIHLAGAANRTKVYTQVTGSKVDRLLVIQGEIVVKGREILIIKKNQNMLELMKNLNLCHLCNQQEAALSHLASHTDTSL